MGWLDPRTWFRRGETGHAGKGGTDASFASGGLPDEGSEPGASGSEMFPSDIGVADGEDSGSAAESARALSLTDGKEIDRPLGEDKVTGASTEAAAPPSPKPKKKRKPGSPNMYNRIEMPTPEMMASEDFMNNCAVRTIMSTVMGAGLGVAFGIFMGTMDTSHIDGSLTADAQKKTFRETMKEVGKSTWSRSKSYGKGFATMGALFSGSECVIETYRAKHDMWNSIYAGCSAGAIMAHSGGPKAMCFGCGSFAAFSYLIDKFMGTEYERPNW